jgi:hypothetical protein
VTRRPKTSKTTSVRKPGPRGWRGPGRGEELVVPTVDEFRASTFQVPGAFYPFSVGSALPVIGAPMGQHLLGGGTVCCDEIAWFQRAGLINVPTMFVIAKVGVGKSKMVQRKLLCQYNNGVLPVIFGDLKGEHVQMTRAIGGQVISLGPGAGALNVLDPGEARDAARRLEVAADAEAAAPDGNMARVVRLRELRDQVIADAHTRRLVGVSGLITIARASKPRDREMSVLDRALRVLDDRWDHEQGAPVLADLLQVIRDAPPAVRAVAIDRGDRSRYDDIVEDLEVSLQALIGGGELGDMFSRRTTEPMRRDRPVCFDVSRLQAAGSPEQKAAGLFSCWTYGMGAINVAHALADAGLEKRRLYSMLLDELWEALRVGHGMPGRLDALLRTNRSRGIGVTMVTHSMADADTLPLPEDREMARSLVKKAGIVMLGGLDRAEMPLLQQVVGLSRAEQDMLTSWQDPGAWNPEEGVTADPPGLGNFLIKAGGGSGLPGIPFHLRLTSVERSLGDTSALWREVSRIGSVADLPPVDPGLSPAAALEEEAAPVRVLHRPQVPAGGAR